MKLTLFLSLIIALAAVAQEPGNNTTANGNAVAPSADFIALPDFIALNEAYQNRPKIPPKDNAFIYLAGITAPEDSDPMTFGQGVIDWSNQKIANGGKSDTPEPKVPYSLGTDAENLMGKITCSIRKASPCALAEHQALAREVINNQATLLKRRQTLLELSGYQNTMTIDLMTSFPAYGSDIKLQQLALMELWLNRSTYPPEKIKQALQKDYDFRLKQSANELTLIGKMVALAGLQNNYYWLNEILKAVDSDTAKALTPRYLHEPIPPSTLSLRMALIGELQFFMSIFKPQNVDKAFNPTAFQLRDDKKARLFNFKAAVLKKLIDISESTDYQTQLERLKEDEAVQQYLRSFEEIANDWDNIFDDGDGFGTLIAPIAIYIDRPRQLVSIQKAVNVLQQIRQEQITPNDIPAFLQRAEQHNPLTKQPFDWDSGKQQMVIPTESLTYYLSL